MFKPPDWQDASAYATLAAAGNACFAWEFLRRNSKYQADWATYVQTLRNGAMDDAELLRLIDAIDSPPGEEDMRWRLVGDELKRSQTLSRLQQLPCASVRTEHDAHRQTITPLDRSMGIPWGIDALVNPGRAFGIFNVRFLAGKGWSQPSSSSLKKLEDRYDGWRHHFESPYLILELDLELPLEVLERLALGAIRSQRAIRANKGHIKPVTARARAPKLMVEYLRLLDAKAASVTLPSIGKVLRPSAQNVAPDFGRDKWVRQAAKQAHKLCDEGFRVLPLLKDAAATSRKSR